MQPIAPVLAGALLIVGGGGIAGGFVIRVRHKRLGFWVILAGIVLSAVGFWLSQARVIS